MRSPRWGNGIEGDVANVDKHRAMIGLPSNAKYVKMPNDINLGKKPDKQDSI